MPEGCSLAHLSELALGPTFSALVITVCGGGTFYHTDLVSLSHSWRVGGGLSLKDSPSSLHIRPHPSLRLGLGPLRGCFWGPPVHLSQPCPPQSLHLRCRATWPRVVHPPPLTSMQFWCFESITFSSTSMPRESPSTTSCRWPR